MIERLGAAIWMNVNLPIHSGWSSRRADKEANFGKIEHFTKQAVVEGARLTAAS